MHSPVTRAAAAGALLALAACADRPSPLDPAGRPPERSTQFSIEGSSAESSRHQRLARRLARALADAEFRGAVHAALTGSPEREGKVYLQRLLTGPLRQRFVFLSGEPDADIGADLESAAPIEIYFPVDVHRSAWAGGPDVLVATAETDGEPPTAFDIRGRVLRLDASRPPAIPVLALVRAEQPFREQGLSFNTCFTACEGEPGGTGGSDDGGGSQPPAVTNPGLYMTYATFNDTFEGWLKGDPEFEVHVLGQDGSSTRMTSYQCAGAGALYPYQYDQNDKQWSGQVMLFSQAQLDAYRTLHPTQSVRIFVLEDDDDACAIKTDTTRVNNLFKDLERVFGAWTGGKDQKTLSLKTFTKAVSLINLFKSTWSFITTQDDVVGTAIEDVVAREFYPGANWIVKGEGTVTNGALRLEMR